MAFIATAAFVDSLVKLDKLPEFTRVRSNIEYFLLAHKDFISLIIKRTGAGKRSLGRITRFFEMLLTQYAAGKTYEQVLDAVGTDDEFRFLIASMKVPTDQEGTNETRSFSRATKSATFLNTAVQGAVRCGICHSLVHVNSMQVDHVLEARSGGGTSADNAQIAHPYCNSAKDIVSNSARTSSRSTADRLASARSSLVMRASLKTLFTPSRSRSRTFAVGARPLTRSAKRSSVSTGAWNTGG